MQVLFSSVNSMMSEGFILTLIGSFIWGILSIALSPCHLTSIPLIIGFIDSTEVKTAQRRFILSFLFALGILISIAIIGILTGSAGRIAGDIGSWSNWFAAGIFAIIGFSFLNIIPLNFNGISSIPIKQKGRRAAFIIGLVFGIALGPCTFAFMAPVLAVSLASQHNTLLMNSMVLISYGIGHSLLIVLAGTYIGTLEKYLKWNNENDHTDRIKKITGVLLLLGALYFIWKT